MKETLKFFYYMSEIILQIPDTPGHHTARFQKGGAVHFHGERTYFSANTNQCVVQIKVARHRFTLTKWTSSAEWR